MRIFFTITLLFSFLFSNSQELPLHSQYLVNPYWINPSTAGISGCVVVHGFSRQQWVGLAKAPKIYGVSYHQRFGKIGLGGIIFNDRNGLTSNLEFESTFAFHVFKTRSAHDDRQLSFGLSFCGYQRSVDETQFIDIDNDPLVSGILERRFGYNANFGMYFLHKDFFTGFSCLNLLPHNNSLSKSTYEPENLRNYIFQIGYTLFSNKVVPIEPSILLKSYEFFKNQMDINLKCYYQMSHDNTVWIALSYRRNLDKNFGESNAIIPFIGFNHKNIGFTYAYDYALSSPGPFRAGSHEISIGLLFCPIKRTMVSCPAFRSYRNGKLR